MVIRASLAVQLALLFTTEVAMYPSFHTPRWKPLSDLIEEILNNHFPRCELILLQDSFFSRNMNSWLITFTYPYYSITLDGKPFPDYTTWKDVTKTAGFTCSTVIAVCMSFSSCRNNDSQILFTMLHANGLILREKRAIIYIEDGSSKDQNRIYLEKGFESFQTVLDPVSYQEQDIKEYTIPALNDAKRVLRELRTHITILRKIRVFKGNGSTRTKILNYSEFYTTITFSPNWVPGGTPVFKNVWSSRNGFAFPTPLYLSIRDIREGGKVRFCASNKDILPMLSVLPGEPPHGIEGEMIRMFERQFRIQIEIFEPSDYDYGRREKSGNWTGVIGYVMRREADFGIGQITFSFDRFVSGLKFTPAFIMLRAAAVCPLPKLLPRFNALLQPFEGPAWLYIGLFGTIVVVTLQVMQCWALRSIRIPIAQRRRERLVPWIQLVGPILLKSVSLNALPRRWALLGLTGIWLILSLVISCSYVSLLISALGFPAREPFVTSPKDLVRRSMTFAIAPVVKEAIENSILADERDMYRKAVKIENDTAYGKVPESKVFTFVRKTGDCAIADRLRAVYMLGQGSLKFGYTAARPYISPEAILIGPTGWAMRSDVDFLLVNYFDKALIQFRSNGFLAKTMKDFNQRNLDVDESVTSGFQAIKMETIYPVFTCALCCLFVSLLVFGYELVVHKLKLNSRTKGGLSNPHVVP